MWSNIVNNLSCKEKTMIDLRKIIIIWVSDNNMRYEVFPAESGIHKTFQQIGIKFAFTWIKDMKKIYLNLFGIKANFFHMTNIVHSLSYFILYYCKQFVDVFS